MKLGKQNMWKAAMIGALACAAISASASAHGIWFAQRAKQIALVYGIGADDLDMVKRLPKLNTTTAWDANWKPVAVTLKPAGVIPVVTATAPYVALGATMDYGMWAKRPDGEFENKGKDEVPNAVLGERTFKYTVFLAKMPTTPVPLFKDHVLQLVPVGAIPQMIGQPATFRAFFQGQPAAGVEILTDFVNDPDMKPLKTGADGTISFPLRNQGLNVIAATIIGKTDQPKKYDYIEYRATLSFVLPHAPE